MDAEEGGGFKGLGSEPTLMYVHPFDSWMQEEPDNLWQKPDGWRLFSVALGWVLKNHGHSRYQSLIEKHDGSAKQSIPNIDLLSFSPGERLKPPGPLEASNGSGGPPNSWARLEPRSRPSFTWGARHDSTHVSVPQHVAPPEHRLWRRKVTSHFVFGKVERQHNHPKVALIAKLINIIL